MLPHALLHSVVLQPSDKAMFLDVSTNRFLGDRELKENPHTNGAMMPAELAIVSCKPVANVRLP